MKHKKSLHLPASLSSSFSSSLSSTPLSESSPQFVELLARSNFSFLQGASHPEELVIRAKALDYEGLAVCDVNGLYGVVRGFQASEKPSAFDAEQLEFADRHGKPKKPFHYICGAELTPHDSSPITLLPMTKEGYVRLSRLITKSKRRAPKGHIVLPLKEILEANEDLIAIPLPPWKEDDLKRIQEAFQDRVYLPVCRDLTWDAIRTYQQALKFERELGIPPFATQRPLFHEPTRKPLHDVLTCILHGTTLDDASTRLTLNAQRYMRSKEELAKIYHERLDLLSRTLEIAERINFSLTELRYRYPQEALPLGKTASDYLRDLTLKGLKDRYPNETPEFLAKARKQADHELHLIQKLEYEDYFLTLRDICQFAKNRGILHQGRGSAANSIVCFAIGLTSVDPIKLGLLFERFISENRGEPPDIDIDFEHERREEVIQYIYNKYGEQRAAMVCTVICYRSRMAIREVAKVMGIPLENIGKLIKFMGREGLSRLVDIAVEKGLHQKPIAKPKPQFDHGSRVHHIPSKAPVPQGEANVDISQFGLDEEKFQHLLRLSLELQGFPRHLGIHSGGFVISNEAIVDIVPVEAATMEGRHVIQWNKDDISILGLMKIDILALGMLTAVNKALLLLKAHKNRDWNLAQIPHDDPGTYQMIQKADTVGVFQIESRAQMSLLPRLKPKNYYDLVIEVAIVRPGPIQGGMVHPYLKRRAGKEKITYEHPRLEKVLKKTLGIPLFQEQIMQIAVEVAGFTPGEADELRRVVSSAWKKKAVMTGLRQRVINGMLANGLTVEYAEQIYKTIEGFSSYGFPESHAASFALITYISCYLKHNYPDVFACALLNSQPMGFYAPRQLISDAQRHGVQFLPLDVQHSSWEYELKPLEAEPVRRLTASGMQLKSATPVPLKKIEGHAVRVGMCSVQGLREEHAKLIIDERKRGGIFNDLSDLIRRTKISRASLIRLAAAGSLKSFGLDPRQAIWAIQSLSFDEQSLFFGESLGLDSPRESLETNLIPEETPWENIRREYQTKGFSIDSHPIGVLRPNLIKRRERYSTAHQLESIRDRTPVRVAGLMSLLQKPPTAKGMCFISLEDETGLMNVVVTPDLYQKFRLILMQKPLLDVEGKLESREGVRNIRAQTIRALTF